MLAGGEFDLVVVGGGPGGYPAAILAAKAGFRVVLVERDRVGGECTNYGCVPSKAVIEPLKALELASHVWGRLSVEHRRVFEYASSVAREVSEGLRGLLESLGVEIVNGEARLVDGGVRVGGSRFEARLGTLCACGSRPLIPSGFVVDNVRVFDNRGFYTRGPPPDAERFLVVGGGFIGVEAAASLAMAGYRVRLAEALDRLLPGFDRDLGRLARRVLTRLGVEVSTRSPVARLEPRGGRVEAVVNGVREVYDAALVAVGRVPDSAVAREAGARVDGKGFVRVDSCMRTSLPGLYAAGDVAGPPLLAHKAIHESIRAFECMSGAEPMPVGPIPSVVYGPVEFVSVGQTLEEAVERDPGAFEVRIPTGGFSRQRILGVVDGFVKLVVAGGRIVGVHAAFPGASEVAGEASLLVSVGIRLEDVAETVHPHPTLAEALWEAAMEALGGSVHVRKGGRRAARV